MLVRRLVLVFVRANMRLGNFQNMSSFGVVQCKSAARYKLLLSLFKVAISFNTRQISSNFHSLQDSAQKPLCTEYSELFPLV